MAISNAIGGVNTTFATGVGDWSATNATAVRDLNRSIYKNAIKYNSSTAQVQEHAAKVTANSTTAPTFELDSISVSGGANVLASCRVASSLITSSYARLDITFYDAVGAQTGSVSTGSARDVSAQANTLNWWLLVNTASAPDDAVTAKFTLTFGRNESSDVITTAAVGDYWLVASPGLVSFTNFDWFTYNAYQRLPNYVRTSDEDVLTIFRFMITLFKSASEVRELAKGMRYDRAVEGTEHLPTLADPDNMSYLYFDWLANILGVKLGASASAAGSNWSTLFTLADTDAGKAHVAADGTKGDGIVTWAEWNREFGTVSAGTADFTQADDTWTTASAHGLDIGDSIKFTSSDTNPTEYNTSDTYYVVAVDTTTTFQLSTTPGGSVLAGTVDSGSSWSYDALASFEWSQIAGANAGSFDGIAASRVLLKHAASGVHAGKLSTMDAFLREFVDPAYQFLLKPLEYTSPQFTKLVADNRDVTDGGLVLDNFLDLISPAGTSTVVSASSTPMKESATFAFLSNYYGESTGTFGPQGIANEAGGAVTAALMASQIDTLPVLGGIIGPAPFGPGCALLSGYRVAAEEVDADYDLGVSGSTENFDLIIGVSSVTLPPTGGGTSSASIPADSRYLARGENWSLHLNNAGNVILVWDINGTPQILTSSATYDFGNKSDVTVQYIRINKVGTALKLYVQDSLFSDWDDNQLGTDLTITTSAITGATSDYLRVLESDDPSSNDYVGSLSCAVHRVLLFTASSGSAWAESAGEYYDYEGHPNKKLDLDFGELDSTNYYDTQVDLGSGVVFDINDNGGANLNAVGGANDLTIANDGTYDYVNISTQEILVYDDEPLFVHDEFTFTTVLKDPASTPDLKLINYAHEDIGTVFTLELIQDTTTKVSVSLLDGASSPTTLAPTDLDTSGWSAGEWHTITATYSPANGLKLYDDGVLSATDASSELVFADISQGVGSLGRRSNVQIGEGSTATGNVDCRYVAFHNFEMTAAQALALAGELGTV